MTPHLLSSPKDFFLTYVHILASELSSALPMLSSFQDACQESRLYLGNSHPCDTGKRAMAEPGSDNLKPPACFTLIFHWSERVTWSYQMSVGQKAQPLYLRPGGRAREYMT